MELHDVSYGIEYVARPLLLFFSSEINFLLGLLKWTYALYLLGLLVSAGMDTLDNTEYEPEDQELEVRYLYMEKIQEVTPYAADNSGPIFDTEPLEKVQNDDYNYNVFANDREHPEQPESVNDTYLEEQGDTNITTDSLDMSTNRETVDHDGDDLARERDLLVSLIDKLKCKIDDSKNRNKLLESSNKTLVNKLKGEIEDFKIKNKSLKSSNKHFKEANNELSKTNQLMFKYLKKFQAELDRYHDLNYVSNVVIDCAKAKGELVSYKMESQKSFNEYTRKINDLNQIISEMKKELYAHQETISIMSQEKEAQNKFYKTREDKEIEKVIALENKVKVLDGIVYKTSQSVQTMNMLNRNCKMSFVKPEYLKKAQRANPRLYDIGCYIDNLSLMLAPESDEMIRLAHESRSKLRVISTTSVSRPQLKSNRLEDRVMHNNSEGKKQQVEDHHRNFKFSNNKTSVTACNDSLNAKNSNVNFVCVTCGKCVLNDNHDITRKPIRTVNQSVATPLKKTVAAESTNQKPRSKIRKQYEHISKTCKWWYSKITPPGYKWKPKTSTVNVKPNVSMHLGTKSRTTTILEPTTLRKSTISNTPSSSNSFAARRDNSIHHRLWVLKAHDGKSQASKKGHYQEGNDLLTCSRGSDLYSITLQDTTSPNPICLMAKATSSQAWLWHRRLSHLNFDTINLLLKYDIVTGLPKLKFIKDHLCSSCELGKAKRKSFHTKTTLSSKRRWQILHMDLCGPMRVESFNGTKFLKKTLHAYFGKEGIEHQTSTARTPEQNGVLERRNRTLVEAARTMLSTANLPLFLWAEAIETTYGENLEKMKEKGDACIFVGYYTQSRAYRVYNKRTRLIVETIHVNFDELPRMASDHVSSDPVPQCPTTALEHESLILVVSKSSVVTTADEPNQHQQQHTTPSTSTTVAADTPILNIQTTTETTSQAPTVTANENTIQAETNKEHAQVDEDEFINIFSTSVQERGETSSRYVDFSNMHTFYQRHPLKHRWTKDHPLEQVIGNPSQSI
ncbi:retrovirus-related pol polyprotein from transposon TNT 1-94 [Tanacetum coccineum]